VQAAADRQAERTLGIIVFGIIVVTMFMLLR
jgi:hypothetical protein